MRVRGLGQLSVVDDDGAVLGADDLPRRARGMMFFIGLLTVTDGRP